LTEWFCSVRRRAGPFGQACSHEQEAIAAEKESTAAGKHFKSSKTNLKRKSEEKKMTENTCHEGTITCALQNLRNKDFQQQRGALQEYNRR
jgi:hypothetical protein